MKRTFLALVTLLLTITTYAQTKADQLNGTWVNEKNTIRIEFFKSSTGYAAKIIWLAEPNDENGKLKLNVENPNAALRKNTLVGTVIIYNLKFDGKRTYNSGKIYAPRRGMTADCSIKVVSSTQMEITGKKGLFNETKTWTRCK